MARNPRKERPAKPREVLPPAGAAYVYPTEDGRLGLSRVLREVTDEERRWYGDVVLVAV